MAKGKSRQRRQRPVYFDYNLLACVIILMFFGLVMLYSASAYEAANDATVGNDDMYYFTRQLRDDIIAFAACLFAIYYDYHKAIKISPYIYILSLILMGLVQSPLGLVVNGAKRWLKLGPISFQPSEIAKIAVILFMPWMIMRMGRYVKTIKGVIVLLFFGLLQAAFAFFFTDNLSTAIIIAMISFILAFLASPKTKPFIIFLLIVAFALILFVLFVKYHLSGSSDFRIRRILAWLDPESNTDTNSYQVLQGLYAIGSGGFFGKGLGNSSQKLSTIPEAQNDMIFAIICEELGLFGAIIVLLLFGYLLYRICVIAMNAPDLYGTLVASGVFTHIALQVILNICVVLNIIPTTGVTLPFVSYGGTSVLFLMLEIGLVLNISRNIRYEGETDEDSDAVADVRSTKKSVKSLKSLRRKKSIQS
ncbi:MAG: putative peptidoglycan glycosyltransferase FtsW [Eubacteriales bacterium]|jgi:cell division protein FtsW